MALFVDQLGATLALILTFTLLAIQALGWWPDRNCLADHDRQDYAVEPAWDILGIAGVRGQYHDGWWRLCCRAGTG